MRAYSLRSLLTCLGILVCGSNFVLAVPAIDEIPNLDDIDLERGSVLVPGNSQIEPYEGSCMEELWEQLKRFQPGPRATNLLALFTMAQEQDIDEHEIVREMRQLDQTTRQECIDYNGLVSAYLTLIPCSNDKSAAAVADKILKLREDPFLETNDQLVSSLYQSYACNIYLFETTKSDISSPRRVSP